MQTHEGMIHLSVAQVPMYLRCGEYFKSLSEGDDELFDVPSTVLKADQSIVNSADLRNLLLSMQFWIVCSVECKEAILTYMLSTGLSEEMCGVILEFETTFPILTIARFALLTGAVKPSKKHPSALVQYVLLRHPASLAILLHLCDRCLEDSVHMAESDRRIRAFLRSYTVEQVAECGELEMLKMLHSHNIRTVNLCYYAANGGHLACLQFLTSQGCTLTEEHSLVAAAQGYLDILQYIYSHDKKSLSQVCCLHAAEKGHLACLQFLHSVGSPRMQGVASRAALGGHLHCLQFIYENGYPWDEDACANAARGEHFDCLQFLHEHGCPWDANTTYYAAMAGNMQCLEYAHTHGCDWGAHICAGAAGNNRLNALQYAHEHGCPWDTDTVQCALPHEECLQYALMHGCPHDHIF